MCCRAVKIFRVAFLVDLYKVFDPNAIHITHTTDQVLQMLYRSQNSVKIKEKSFSTLVFVLLLCLFVFFFQTVESARVGFRVQSRFDSKTPFQVHAAGL